MASPRMRFEPGDVEEARVTIEELADLYESWHRVQHPGANAADGSDLELLLDWKVGYGDGRLDEWSVADVEEFLLYWCPRKVSAPPSWAVAMVESVANGLVFLGERGLLSPSSAPADRLAAHTRSLAGECKRRMGDSSNFGMAKSLFAGMGVDFEEELSQEGLNSLTEQFNALPYEQRKAFTDPFMGPGPQEQLSIGPVVLPSEEEVRAAAAAAPVLAGFRALCDYFEAPGRPLTAAGNIKLADAGALSEILGSEPLAETYAGHTFRRRSSARMPELDHWQWWANEVGALRVVKSRMVGVKSWRDRCEEDPIGEASRAFETLIDYGVVSSYRSQIMFPGDDLIDQAVVPLLSIPLRSPHPVEFTEMVDAVVRMREEFGIEPPLGSADLERNSVCRNVDRMLTMLERAGVVIQHDVTYEPSRMTERRSGGTVALTPFGVVMVVEHARRTGVTVETIDPPESLTAHDLADLAVQQAVDVDVWWDVLVRWLAGQEDPRWALTGLFDTMEAATVLAVLVAETPDELVDDFAAVLRRAFDTRDPDDPVAVAAFGWLVEHGRLDPGEVSPETVELTRFALLGLLVEVDPESVDVHWGVGQSRPELLAEVAEISRLMPANVEALLEAIGRHYPDQVVAKGARRELLKVRSRLANQRRG